jgi:ornithine cyclodeaminase
VPAADAGALRVFDAAAVADGLPYARLIDALQAGFRAEVEAPVRAHHHVERPGAAPGDLLLMPAWQPGAATGVKLVTISPGNEERGLASVQALYVLFDGPSGVPRAVLDAAPLTVRRTACASALASFYLSRPESRHLVMVGAGALAPHLIRAHAAVRPIDRVSIWNRTRAKAEQLAGGLRQEGVSAAAVDDLDEVLPDADIVSCATMAREPLVKGVLLAPGCHVDLVGAYRPDMREADDDAVRRAELFVDTRAGALAEAGDIILPLERGVIATGAIRADLFDLCRGRHRGRTDRAAITLFKSVGSALEDLVAARLVVEGSA